MKSVDLILILALGLVATAQQIRLAINERYDSSILRLATITTMKNHPYCFRIYCILKQVLQYMYSNMGIDKICPFLRLKRVQALRIKLQ